MRFADPPTGMLAGNACTTFTPAGSVTPPIERGASPELVTVKVFAAAVAPTAAAPRPTARAWALARAVTPSATPIPGMPTETVNASWTDAPERSVAVTVIVAVPCLAPDARYNLPAASTRTEAIAGSELLAARPKAVAGEATTVAERSMRRRSRMLSLLRPATELTGRVANVTPALTRVSAA